MPQVLAWECKSTGKLFKDKPKYISHLRKLAAARMHEKRLQRIEDTRIQFIVNMGAEVTSFESLEEFISSNWKWFMGNAHWRRAWCTKGKRSPDHELVRCSFTQMRWNESTSNSHCAPRNGVENWGGKPDKPVGYPGWHGRIELKVRAPKGSSGFGSDYFEKTGINTGTGGGGGVDKDGVTHYSYEVTIFADDFTTMGNRKLQELMWKELSS